MVTIIVIAVLVALIVPATQSVMESSRMARCASNLRALGIEALALISENNGALAWYERPKEYSGMWWHKILVRSNFSNFSKRMSCPSYKSPYQYEFSLKDKVVFFGNYRYNKFMGYQDKNKNWIYPLTRIQTVSQPSRLALLADDRTDIPNGSDDSSGFESWKPIRNAHKRETTGVLFCLDGHIEFITEENPRKIEFVPWLIK